MNITQEVYYDDYGIPYVLDEHGNRMPPLQIEGKRDSSGWMNYDTSQGHCGLCGRLTCNGYCFK